MMSMQLKPGLGKDDPIIREIIGLERNFFLERRDSKTKRLKELRDLIERYSKSENTVNDS